MYMEFRGLLPGEGARQITLWILGGGSRPLRDPIISYILIILVYFGCVFA
jgi:hypothetical protein